MARLDDNGGEVSRDYEWDGVKALLSSAGGGAVGGVLGGPLGAGVLGSVTGAGAGVAAYDTKQEKERGSYDRENTKENAKLMGISAGAGGIGQYLNNEYGEAIEEAAIEGMNAASEGLIEYAHEVAAHAGDAPKSALIGVGGLVGAAVAIGTAKDKLGNDEDYDL